MKKKTNIAVILLITSILIIMFGCGSKKKVIEQRKSAKIEIVKDSVITVKDKLQTKKKDVETKTSNIKIEYVGETKNDSLSVTHNPNGLIITGKGKLLINSFSTNQNMSSNEVNSETDTKISNNVKSVLNEEIQVKEEMIKQNNVFNFYVIGLLVLIIAVLFLINWIKNKFKLNG